MFYCIKEGEAVENYCTNLVKSVIIDIVKMNPEEVKGITIDRAYRMDRKSSSKSTRVSLVYRKGNDKVPKEKQTKLAKLGIGEQYLREAKTTLPSDEKGKDRKKNVRFMRLRNFSYMEKKIFRN